MATAGLIVHEWLAAHGGSENVFYALADAFPDADLLALWNDRSTTASGREIAETWLSRTSARRHKALAMPLMLPTWRWPRGRHDWVVASSHAFAHHVTTRPASAARAVKLAYVHTPARYVWAPDLDRRGSSTIVRAVAGPVRRLDRVRARELDGIAVNSAFVRSRVERAWDRSAVVIHPPVDVARVRRAAAAPTLSPSEQRLVDALPDEFVLGASRFVRYKALDDVVSVGEAVGLPVVLAGAGPDGPRLREVARLASVPVSVVDSPSDDLLATLYRRARCYVFPALEDFGIMPVEAMAVGTAVIALDAGGAQESVVEGRSGVRVPTFADRSGLADAVSRAGEIPPATIRECADAFAVSRFTSQVRAWVARYVGDVA